MKEGTYGMPPIRRNTIQRQTVIDALKSLDHPTAAEIYSAVHARAPQVSLGTVYRNLSSLCEEGLVLKLTVPGSADRFDLPAIPHCHMRCRECGRLFDILEPCMSDLNRMMRDKTGMELDGQDAVFTGLCSECAKKLAVAPKKSDGHGAS